MEWTKVRKRSKHILEFWPSSVLPSANAEQRRACNLLARVMSTDLSTSIERKFSQTWAALGRVDWEDGTKSNMSGARTSGLRGWEKLRTSTNHLRHERRSSEEQNLYNLTWKQSCTYDYWLDSALVPCSLLVRQWCHELLSQKLNNIIYFSSAVG